MSFGQRLTALAAAAVALAILIGSAALYLAVQAQLVSGVDSNLNQLAGELRIERGRGGFTQYTFELPPPLLGGPSGYVQLIDDSGHAALLANETVNLPVRELDREVAAGRAPDQFTDVRLQGIHLRVLTHHVVQGIGVQVARPLTEVDDTLARLRVVLLLVLVAGVLIAGILGFLVARAALRPVGRLTAAVEHVTTTGDMSQRVEVTSSDELGRLARNFNSMLAALDDSLRSQRQLVADASHELRTPLASLRTNIEVLEAGKIRDPEDRRRLLADLVSQVEQLTRLVQDLIDLARGDQPAEVHADVRLDLITAGVAEKAAGHWPQVRFITDLRPSPVSGDPARLERAIANLLDNAGKWSPSGATVEVAVSDGEVRVRDHGPGIAAEDLPKVFDRFWRAPGARGLPGSGLGLAIVRQVAEAHRGAIHAEAPPGGGTLMVLHIPEPGP